MALVMARNMSAMSVTYGHNVNCVIVVKHKEMLVGQSWIEDDHRQPYTPEPDCKCYFPVAIDQGQRRT